MSDGAREALRDGFASGGSQRNLDWVRQHLRPGPGGGSSAATWRLASGIRPRKMAAWIRPISTERLRIPP